MMSNQKHIHRLTRRDFLKVGGGGALAAMLAGSRLKRVAGSASAAPVLGSQNFRLLATDGFISLPGRRFDPAQMGEAGIPEPLYVFGFRTIAANELTASPDQLIPKYKGKVQAPAPIIPVGMDYELYLTMTNLGLEQRPDLDDAHTIHWHGFRNPMAVFDGVPEVSISVPPARDFPFYFRARDEGTYMYHCHFEDVEHVQMGMDGIIFIEAANGNTYDGDNGATAFQRQFTFMLNEIDIRPHDNLLAVQEFVWSDYKPNYWVMNGRAYPDTILRDQDLPNTDYDLGTYKPKGKPQPLGYTQPVSSLVQLNEGEVGLLRVSSLGYEQHTMQLLGIPMFVVGHDATYLGAQSYWTNSLYIGPGEARDALITAPAYDSGLPGGTDGVGPYNLYWFRNRSAQRLVNGDLPGLGGMLTQVRVYQGNPLPIQTRPNQTF